jgi:hypothetical protein
MNKTLNTTLIVLAVLVLAAAIFFTGTVYGRSNMMFGWNGNNAFRSGMMGQGGMMNIMGDNGGMMNWFGGSGTNLTPLTINQAKAAAEKYLANLNNSNLKIAEVMIFDNNAYVLVKEIDTDLGAFELLVDPASQTAYPEHGPNMIWNLKYSGLNHQSMTLAPGAHMPWQAVPGSAGVGNNSGMMGMMGGNGGMTNMMGNYNWDNTTPADVSAEMIVTSEEAIEYAQKYLDKNLSGVVAATNPIQFYGYYTLDYEKDGKVAGMLSVNGYSGQVFLHTWHGTFIEETE